MNEIVTIRHRHAWWSSIPDSRPTTGFPTGLLEQVKDSCCLNFSNPYWTLGFLSEPGALSQVVQQVRVRKPGYHSEKSKSCMSPLFSFHSPIYLFNKDWSSVCFPGHLATMQTQVLTQSSWVPVWLCHLQADNLEEVTPYVSRRFLP